jgi:hypothetical protein
MVAVVSMRGKFSDLTGQSFGLLRVVCFAGFKQTPRADGRSGRVATWECICTCGATVIRTTSNLGSLKANGSCGHVRKTRFARLRGKSHHANAFRKYGSLYGATEVEGYW